RFRGVKCDRLIGDASDDGSKGATSIPIPDLPEFPRDEILKDEKELLGFYISGHPLDAVHELVSSVGVPIRDLKEANDGDRVRLAVLVSSVSFKFSKKNGKQYAVLTLEDMTGSSECRVYERTLGKIKNQGMELHAGDRLAVLATVDKKEEGAQTRFIMDSADPLDDSILEKETEELYINIGSNACDHDRLVELATKLKSSPGNTAVNISITQPDDSVVFLSSRIRTKLSIETLKLANAILGRGCFQVKPRELPPPRKKWTPPQSESDKE
ncbi:MAG: hypothetical protein MJ025_07120, partial [Victivallaceae bacterium]|nr:hypothetical protein [Victivallaceae bacterium]